MPKILKVRGEELYAAMVDTLVRHALDLPTAQAQAAILLKNEVDGYASHGAMRLIEYLKDVRSKSVSLAACPTVHRTNKYHTVIRGNRSLGIRVLMLLRSLIGRRKPTHMHCYAIENAHHLGRLSTIAELFTSNGYCTIGFANYNGQGQKVKPAGARSGVFATNPLVFAIPQGQESAIIFDMTSSVVSEGAVRQYYLRGKTVPTGWLVDRRGRGVVEAGGLYTDPMRAFLAPLGGEVASHKGFGLGLVAEIFSSLTRRSGNVAHPYKHGGNSALFIAIPMSAFGLSANYLKEHLRRLCRHATKNNSQMRIPGTKKGKGKSTPWIEVPAPVWEFLQSASPYSL